MKAAQQSTLMFVMAARGSNFLMRLLIFASNILLQIFQDVEMWLVLILITGCSSAGLLLLDPYDDAISCLYLSICYSS